MSTGTLINATGATAASPVVGAQENATFPLRSGGGSAAERVSVVSLSVLFSSLKAQIIKRHGQVASEIQRGASNGASAREAAAGREREGLLVVSSAMNEKQNNSVVFSVLGPEHSSTDSSVGPLPGLPGCQGGGWRRDRASGEPQTTTDGATHSIVSSTPNQPTARAAGPTRR